MSPSRRGDPPFDRRELHRRHRALRSVTRRRLRRPDYRALAVPRQDRRPSPPSHLSWTPGCGVSVGSEFHSGDDTPSFALTVVQRFHGVARKTNGCRKARSSTLPGLPLVHSDSKGWLRSPSNKRVSLVSANTKGLAPTWHEGWRLTLRNGMPCPSFQPKFPQSSMVISTPYGMP